MIITKLHKVLKQDQIATKNPRITTQTLHPKQNRTETHKH